MPRRSSRRRYARLCVFSFLTHPWSPKSRSPPPPPPPALVLPEKRESTATDCFPPRGPKCSFLWVEGWWFRVLFCIANPWD
jgi:hypothetical protein